MVESRILRPSYISGPTSNFPQDAKNIYFSVGMMPAPLSKRGRRASCGVGHRRYQGQTAPFQVDEPWGKLCFVFLLSVDSGVVAMVSSSQ